jgi:hypothetical protein
MDARVRLNTMQAAGQRDGGVQACQRGLAGADESDITAHGSGGCKTQLQWAKRLRRQVGTGASGRHLLHG